MSVAPILEVRSLVKQFPVGQGQLLTAVNDVSFTLETRQTLALVGESGSGKTTVGRCVLRLIDATSGAIAFAGQDVTGLSAKRLRDFRRRVQVVFQDPYDSLNPRMRVRALVEEPLRELTGQDASHRAGRVRDLLERVGLGVDVSELYPHHLTTGQQQRVAIARALACDPGLLVLDEPTSSLDPVSRGEIIALLRDLQRDLGTAFLFISHDLVTVRHISDRIAVMYLGEIVETGPVEQVFSRPSHPYTRALLSSAPSIERGRSEATANLSGEIPSPIDLPSGCFLASRCPFVLEGCRALHPGLDPVGTSQRSRCLRATGVLAPLPSEPAGALQVMPGRGAHRDSESEGSDGA
jgi:oligopeptide/dipeptide ABC transporter ATP-binding protein